MLEEKKNSRSIEIKGTETYGKRPATMNQTHQVIGTCAAHISWNLRSRDSEVESKVDNPSERLYFLGQYTCGKAKVLIKGCLQMRSEDSYEVAG